MTDETITALRAYDMLVRHRGLDDVELHWESGTLVCSDGGYAIEISATPASRPGLYPLGVPESTPAHPRTTFSPSLPDASDS